MMEDDILKFIQSSSDVRSCREFLLKYKAAGIFKNEVYEVLKKLQLQVKNEDLENRILDLMDIVSSFCGPNLRVWD